MYRNLGMIYILVHCRLFFGRFGIYIVVYDTTYYKQEKVHETFEVVGFHFDLSSNDY